MLPIFFNQCQCQPQFANDHSEQTNGRKQTKVMHKKALATINNVTLFVEIILGIL